MMKQTRIAKKNVSFPEMALGYLTGPFGALITNAVFTSFLNRFYTDILGMAGKFLTLLPLVSTILVVAGNLIVGVAIDRTKTRFGKARPYLLASAPLLAVACVLIFAVPSGNELLKVVWIAISYNLYFAVAYPIYFMAHSMMVPLSTRDLDQRGKLSVVSNVANMAAAGLFAAIIFPMLIYPKLKNQSSWLTCMCILGAVALAGALLEFAFTRERITEEETAGIARTDSRIKEEKDKKEKVKEIPLAQQIRGVVTDHYWWIIIIYYLLFGVSGGIKNLSMSYYCDYVVGSYQDGITQTVLAVVSGLPMALGIFFVWPLANKFGKKNITVAGLALSVAGGILSLLAPYNFWSVAVGVAVKTLGTIPACYVMMALFADVLDHLEAKNGYRCDGLSMSLYSVITVATFGIITAIFNGLISMSGYAAPEVIGGITAAAEQNDATMGVFIICFLGVETAAYAILTVLLSFLKVEDHIKEEQELIAGRHNKSLEEGE